MPAALFSSRLYKKGAINVILCSYVTLVCVYNKRGAVC